jgi:hypothetical protein
MMIPFSTLTNPIAQALFLELVAVSKSMATKFLWSILGWIRWFLAFFWLFLQI